MATLFVRHEVADFDHWKRAYDDFDPERAPMGVTSHGVWQGDENPNDVTVYHDFDTMEAAKSFAGSQRLREVMEAAGVQSDPKIWFANRV